MQIDQVPIQWKSLPSRGLKTSTPIWLEEKKKRDTELWKENKPELQDLWIVQNKCYDLTSFAKNHPGGQSWITLNKGQDVTEYFMTHHLDQDKAREVLKKYYVMDSPNQVTRFSFLPDGLYRTVKRKVMDKWTKQYIQDQSESKKYAKILISIVVALMFATAYTGSYIVGFITACMLISMLGIGHNFVHHKDSPYRFAFLFTGFIPKEWQIMHCMSHHQYPNTELDYEVAALEPIGYFLRSMPKNFVFIEPLIHSLFVFLQPLNMTLKIVVVPIIKRRAPELLYASPLLFFALIYYFQQDFWLSLKLYFFVYAVYGTIFLKVLFCGHRLEELWTEGAQKAEDYGEHTVLSTSDTDPQIQGILSYVLLAGFNVHVAHHFFPTADHRALPGIMDIIRETCRQKGIKYTTKNRWQCIKSVSKGMIKRKPFINK